MRIPTRLVLLAAFDLLLLCPNAGASANTLESEIASVLPTAQEDQWLSVGWRTNLMQARLEAQRLKRPMFLWVMNGNPLGCT